MALEPLRGKAAVPVSKPVTVQAAASVKSEGNRTNESNESSKAKLSLQNPHVLNQADDADKLSEGSRESGQPSNEQLRQAVEKINKNMGHSQVQFGIHDATNRVTIKVVDKDTKEVIKELPPEQTLDMIAKIWEMAGILVDERG